MKERIKGAFTKKKIFHFLKMALFVVALSLILLSLLGTVAHATGLVDDTINAENLYSKYPLSNYQLDFYVDNSWSWLPWNWLDGIGKSVQYGLYCITNFVWTISLYLSNATGYVVQEAYKLDFINDMADSIGQSIQTLAGVTQNGFSSTNILLVIEDNGCGIKASDLSRVFEKGFTGSNRNKANATGMGLYLSKKLCDRLGLKLDIASTEKEYTRLTITFPKGTVHNFSE